MAAARIFLGLDAEGVGRELGPLVRWWVTINEPSILGLKSYLEGSWPPHRPGDLRGAARLLRHAVRGHVLARKALRVHRPDAQVSMAFARVCKKLGISDFRFHDLRHTAASWLRMQGADIHTVAQLLGHKDLRMAARYQHLSPAFLADAVASLDVVFDLPRHHSVTVTDASMTSPALTA